MRIIESADPRPLNLLAVGAGGLVAVASDALDPPGLFRGVEVWDATRGELLWDWGDNNLHVRALAFALDGRHLLAVLLSGVRLLALDDGAGRRVVEVGGLASPGAAAGAAGGRAFIGWSLWGNHRQIAGPSLTCRRLPDFSPLWTEDRWDDYTQFDVPPAVDLSGGRLAVAVRTGGPRPAQFVSVRDANTGDPLARIPLDAADAVRQLAFTADGANLLARTDGRTVRMFDSATGAPAGELVHLGRPYVTGIAVHPRGPVACARGETVTFWDAEKREQLRTLDWKAGKLVSVAFSPDGALGAAGTGDGKVVVWDVDV